MNNEKAYVYITTNKNQTVLYIGVTTDLEERLDQHRRRLIPGFTKKYNVYYLLFFEEYLSIWDAIAREKQLKKWTRQQKEDLIRDGKERPLTPVKP